MSQVAISNGLKSIDGYYSISLNDYAEDNYFTLDFTKFPDIYQRQNYSGYLNFEDPCPIEDKKISLQAQDFLAKYLNFTTHIFYALQLMQNVEDWNGL